LTSDISYLLATFALSGGTIEGRKRLQKIICVLKHQYDVPFSYNYIPYHYGPYAENLASTIDMLVGIGFLEEQQNVMFDDIIQYIYKLTPEGKKFAERSMAQMKKQDPELLGKMTEAVAEMNDMSIADLVKLSKQATRFMYQY
jgi:uncharacterized protein YwgA